MCWALHPSPAGSWTGLTGPLQWDQGSSAAAGKPAELPSESQGQKTDTGPVSSYLLHAGAKSFLLTALALACSRQLPCRAQDQQLGQLCTFPLSSELVGTMPACSINPSLQDTWNTWTLKKKPIISMATTGNISLPKSPCALHIEGGKSKPGVRYWGLKQTSFSSPFPMQQSLQIAFPPQNPRNAVTFLQALVKSLATISQPCPLLRVRCLSALIGRDFRCNVHYRWCPSAGLSGTPPSSSSCALQRSTGPSVPEMEEWIWKTTGFNTPAPRPLTIIVFYINHMSFPLKGY